MHARRLFELDACLPFLRLACAAEPCRLLEIGAGTGFQAKVMADAGFEVSAVEIASSPYRNERVFPVHDYDGVALPFEDDAFDVIFSSNVLEHVPHLNHLFAEMRRVLKPNGICVHVLPTSAWRVWSMLSHYPWVLKRIVTLVTGGQVIDAKGSRRPKLPNSAATLVGTLFPARHGEHGNAFTEAYHFSASIWRRRFREGGFAEVEEQPAGLFYTNAALLGGRLPMSARKWLATILGSACRIYILRRA